MISPSRLSRTLHLALGLILTLEGVLTLIHALAEHHDLHLLAFASLQVSGALLFTWPRTIRIGACILVCTFAIAAIVHFARGEFPSEHLVYIIAVLFVMTHHGWSQGQQSHGGKFDSSY